jgi:hypothetical protein
VCPGLKINHKNQKKFIHPPGGRPPPSPSSDPTLPQSCDHARLPFRRGPPVACHGPLPELRSGILSTHNIRFAKERFAETLLRKVSSLDLNSL